MKIIKNILQLVLIPLLLAGAFFITSLPRITTDYNFNSDELIYLSRSKYWEAYKTGDFSNPIWKQWGSYDQPQLTNYTYAAVPGDRSLLDNINSPCDQKSDNFNDTWSCLAGKPLTSWSSLRDSDHSVAINRNNLAQLQEMVINARTLGLGISSLVIATTYYLGLLAAGPVAGIIAALFLGWYSFFRNLATMAMMDQILLVLLNLQLLLVIYMIKKRQFSALLLALLSALTGLAISTKFNAFPGTLISYFLLAFHMQKNRVRLAITKLVLSGLTAGLIFVALNPFLWGNILKNLEFMVSWRLKQASNQVIANQATQAISFRETITYSLTEALSTWDHLPYAVYPLLTIAGLGLITLMVRGGNKSLIFYIIASLATLLLYLPLKWNRYLLPIMPLISLLIGNGLITLGKVRQLKFIHLGLAAVALFTILAFVKLGTFLTVSEMFVLLLSGVLMIQGALVTIAMLFGFTHPQDKNLNQQVDKQHSFSLILPVRQESAVIADTLQAMAKINYPNDKYEVLVPVRADDYQTIEVINQTLSNIRASNIHIIPVDGDAHTKSYSLNLALHYAKGEIVGVFDAEDEPHPDLLSRINDEMARNPSLAAVQAPVQLINLNSNWYSALNSLEYYFWFQSVLPFLTKHGLTPLGGNTIFIKHQVLTKLGGWDETSLTEDADMGIRLATHNLPVSIITDHHLATLEEAPSDELGIVRQRSRWDQGYLQVLSKADWRHLSHKQKLLAVYTLSQPIFRHLAFLNMFLSPLLALVLHVNTGIALLSFLPTYFLLMQWGMYLIGLHDLSHKYRVRINFWRYLSTVLFFYPYQALLSLATLRAIGKIIIGNKSWDKTIHFNRHRTELALAT